MKKWILLLLIMLSIGLISCKNQGEKGDNQNNIFEDIEGNNQNGVTEAVEWKFGRKSSFVEGENGWFYVFTHNFEKEDLGDIGLLPYNFYGVNLKYRYHEDYMIKIKDVVGGEIVEKNVPQTIQILGQSNSIAIKNDMNEIASILKYNGGEVSNEELLSLTTDDLTFEAFDEEIFLDLIQEALNGEPHKEGKYSYLPSYALLEEEDYLNNYKFQVGFINTQGCIDAVVIDVLYRTGRGYDNYKQLSDIVASEQATKEQIKLYDRIEEIEEGIVENNTFLYFDGGSEEIADVYMPRLSVFLEDIEKNEYQKYVVNPGE